MPVVKQLDLLREVKKRHPDGVIEGNRRKIITLIELGGKGFRTPDMSQILKDYWKPSDDDILYIISLEGIDVLTPSAAKILVESASNIACEYKKPVIFTQVRPELLESLESEARRFNPAKLVWAIDENGEAHLVGPVPNRFKELLDLLEDKGRASASHIAILQEGESSKKAIGKVSVYLQDLFNVGLVGREKITALDRKDAERGWTYSYYTAPTVKRNTKLETYVRKP